MKHLKKFEEFNESRVTGGPYPDTAGASKTNNDMSYAPGDIVFIMHNGEQTTAKIKKVNSTNSFIVNIEVNQQFQTPPVEISYDDIIGMAKSNSDPAMNNDVMNTYSDRVSNDLVINGYPKST